MKTFRNPNFRNAMKYSFIFLLFIILLFAYGCDTFEEDAVSPDNSVELSSEDILVMANSSSVIDFNRIVKAQQTVSVEITDEPDRGEFNNIQDNLFVYEPDSDFLEGTDVIGFDVMDDDDEVITSGTIDITISQDAADFPCAVIAIGDRVEVSNNDQMVIIDVLANDILCDISPDELVLSIERHPGNGAEAAIQDQKITFFPGAGFEQTSMIYKITSVNASDTASYGLVDITLGAPPCQIVANNDVYNFELPIEDMVPNEPINVNVLANDILCRGDQPIDALFIFQQGNFGDAAFAQDSTLNYWPNVSRGTHSDVVTYRICSNDVCNDATVTFNFIESQQPLVEGVDDQYDLRQLPPADTYTFDVLQNDVFTNLSLTNIEVIDQGDHGQAWANDKLLWYSPAFGTQAETDTLVYRVCEIINDQQVCDEAKVAVTLQ